MSAGHHIFIDEPVFKDPEIRPHPRVELDLPENFGFELSDTVEELNDINNLKQPGVFPITLPATALNKRYLQRFTSLNTLSKGYSSVDVSAWVWGKKLPFDSLYVLSYDRGSKEISCELAVGSEHYIEKAKKKFLNTIDLGTFLFDVSGLEANWLNDSEYQDGGVAVHHPFLDVGRFDYEEGEAVTYEYFRPTYSPLALLRKGFCEIGFAFYCPYLETPIGRKYWAYLLSENFFDDIPNNGREYYGLEATFDRPSELYTIDHQGSELVFAGNDADPSRVILSFGSANRDLFTKVCFSGTVTNNSVDVETFSFLIESIDGASNSLLLFQTESTSINPGETIQVDYCTEVFENPRDRNVAITFQGSGTLVELLMDTGFEISVILCEKKILLGTEYSPAPLIHPEYTLYDILAGIAHAINGKLSFNHILNRVELYTPKDVEVEGQLIEGFLRTKQPGILLDTHLSDDALIRYPSTRQNKFLRLQFKSSSDSYLKLQEFPDDSPPHSRTIDMGEAIDPAGIDVFENPFFEPTIERQTYEMNSLQEGISIPALWDNDDGELSFKIGPRIFIAIGQVSQWNEAGNRLARWFLGPNERLVFPYVSQVAETKYFSTQETADHAITYGDFETTTSYQYGWRIGVNEQKGSLIFSIDVSRSLAEYFDSQKFRRTYSVFSEGEAISVRLSRVEAYDTGQLKFARMIFVQLQDDC